MTVALVLCAVVCVVLLVMWRRAEADARTYAAAARDANQRSSEQQAELDALSIAPPAAVAALQPDAPSLLPDEIEQWLRARTPTIRPALPEES